jgi:hypothetical protein
MKSVWTIPIKTSRKDGREANPLGQRRKDFIKSNQADLISDIFKGEARFALI